MVRSGGNRHSGEQNTIERAFETLLFQSRWIAAPIYLGLVFGVVILLIAFANKLFASIPGLFALKADEAVLLVLTFVTTALVTGITGKLRADIRR